MWLLLPAFCRGLQKHCFLQLPPPAFLKPSKMKSERPKLDGCFWNLCPSNYSNTGKSPGPVPGSPTGVSEDGVNGVTVTMWCNRALGGLTLHTSRISTCNRHLLQNCQVSPPLLSYLWEMKSAAEINCCAPPALGEEGNPSLNESFLRIIFVWSGFSCEGLKNSLQNGSEIQIFV